MPRIMFSIRPPTNERRDVIFVRVRVGEADVADDFFKIGFFLLGIGPAARDARGHGAEIGAGFFVRHRGAPRRAWFFRKHRVFVESFFAALEQPFGNLVGARGLFVLVEKRIELGFGGGLC